MAFLLRQSVTFVILLFSSAISFADKSEVQLLSQLHSNLGTCYFKLEKYKFAVSHLNKAIDFYPFWEKPFLKRSDVFKKIVEMSSSLNDEDKRKNAEDRLRADIIVDQHFKMPRKKGDQEYRFGILVFPNLAHALEKCRDGNVIFIEEGTYSDINGYAIDKHNITMLGARGSNVVLTTMLGICIDNSSQRFPDTGTLIKNIKFQSAPNLRAETAGILIEQGINIRIEDCCFNGRGANLFYNAVVFSPEVAGCIKPTAKSALKTKAIETYHDVEFKASEKAGDFAIATIQNCHFVECSDTAISVSNGTSVCKLDNCFIEGTVTSAHGARTKMHNCEVQLRNFDKKESEIITDHESAFEFVGCLIASNIREKVEYLAAFSRNPAIISRGHSDCNVRKCFFHRNELCMKMTTGSNGTLEDNYVKLAATDVITGAEYGGFNAGFAITRESTNVNVLNNRFEGPGPGVKVGDTASCNITSNDFKQSCVWITTSGNPTITDNTFEFDETKEGPTPFWCGVRYESGGYGLCQENLFKNFTKGTEMCITVAFSETPGAKKTFDCRPKLMKNAFENCPVYPLPEPPSHLGLQEYQDLPLFQCGLVVRCSDEEKRVTDFLLANIKKNKNIRLCHHCKETRACKLCNACKIAYYCSQDCQAGDLAQHKIVCKKVTDWANKR